MVRRMAWVLLVGAVACGTSDPATFGASGATTTACLPGEQRACACPGGAQGAQACTADGTALGDCGCDGGGGAGQGGAAAGGGAPGGAGTGGASTTAAGGAGGSATSAGGSGGAATTASGGAGGAATSGGGSGHGGAGGFGGAGGAEPTDAGAPDAQADAGAVADGGAADAGCNVGDHCDADANPCHVGARDAQCNCVPSDLPNGAACDDGNACTTGDTCANGACTGAPIGGVVTYFSETFKDNSKGWTLGLEWEIGFATASPGDGEGGSFEDPAEDHTSGDDNGVAGVVIGGYPDESAEHDFRYLVSPPVNVAAAPAKLYVQFWRWLNTDSSLWMPNAIDCSADGVTWTNIWKSVGENDSEWTPVSYDVTACKSAAMRIRWGFAIADASGIYTESSWNVDDVSVVNVGCY